MEIAIIDNFIDLSYMVALVLAGQIEKKIDLFGFLIKRGVSDTIKVIFIGFVHSLIWIFFFEPEKVGLWNHIKIILTSYMATVVLYDYLVKKFNDKYNPKI